MDLHSGVLVILTGAGHGASALTTDIAHIGTVVIMVIMDILGDIGDTLLFITLDITDTLDTMVMADTTVMEVITAIITQEELLLDLVQDLARAYLWE